MDKKTIYFHIGTHKTGTTALQKFFVDNKELLKQKGFIYDFYNESEMNQGYLVKPEKWNEISLDPSKDYIISGEDFYSNILNITKTIKENLSEFNIHFIVYFKRQDLMKESVYNQIVKMHGFTKEVTKDNHYNLDYYQFLQQLKQSYPETTTTVRVYEKGQFEGGTIFSDFLKILGLELTNDFILEKKIVNPSLTTDKLEFTRHINMLDLPVGFRTKLNKLVVKSALDSNEASLYRKQDLISPSDAKELLVRYKDGNAAIAKEYLGRESGDLFYEDVVEDDNWQAYPGLSSEVAKEIIEKINEMDSDALEKLYENIFSQQSRTGEFVKAANLLMPILIKVLGKNIEFKPLANQVEPVNKFTDIKEKLSADSHSADILREVAFAFEQSRDIQTAFKVMQQAHILRPKGPLINQKLQEYSQILETKSTSIPPEGIETIERIGHRDYVGGMWNEIGKLQFDFLVAQGLKPEHTLLDIACGSLRGGVHFINYINPGNYLGIDKESELIARGVKEELGKDKEAHKKPEFIISDRFEFGKFSKKPDYAIAQSLFTHLIEKDLKLCLQNLKEFVKDKPFTLFATFFECETPQKGELDTSHSHVKFDYTKEQMEQFGKETGWHVEYIGEWNHPRGQKMMKFYNRELK